jgi:hypothetical protein
LPNPPHDLLDLRDLPPYFGEVASEGRFLWDFGGNKVDGSTSLVTPVTLREVMDGQAE